MIKIETVGMLDVAKINPVLKSTSDVTNYDFITFDNILYLICNTIVGDNSYRENVVIPAGEYLNGYQVDAFIGQKLVVDEKHIAYASGQSYDDLKVADASASPAVAATILTVNANGKLAIASSAPESGIYFKVTDKVNLTEKAVKVLVCAA